MGAGPRARSCCCSRAALGAVTAAPRDGLRAPGPALLVGDSETDCATARAAGVPYVLRRGGYRHASEAEIAPDAAFDDFDELPAVIEAVLAG